MVLESTASRPGHTSSLQHCLAPNPLPSNLFQFLPVINSVSITHSLLVLRSPHFAAGPVGCISQMAQTQLFCGILLTQRRLTGQFARAKLRLKLFLSSIPSLCFFSSAPISRKGPSAKKLHEQTESSYCWLPSIYKRAPQSSAFLQVDTDNSPLSLNPLIFCFCIYNRAGLSL